MVIRFQHKLRNVTVLWQSAFLAAASLCLCLAGCHEANSSRPTHPVVKTMPITLDQGAQQRTYSGVIVARHEVQESFRVGGRIRTSFPGGRAALNKRRVRDVWADHVRERPKILAVLDGTRISGLGGGKRPQAKSTPGPFQQGASPDHPGGKAVCTCLASSPDGRDLPLGDFRGKQGSMAARCRG